MADQPLSSLDPPHPPRLALVGDRSPDVQAHSRIPRALQAANAGDGDPVELYWVHSTAVREPADVAGFDGIWVIPGSPYESTEGVLTAVRTARQAGIPFLGTCGGFQHFLLEFARDVCGLGAVANAEESPSAPEQLIVPLACSLLGEEATIVIAPGTRAAEVMGAGPSTERFFCRYGLNPEYAAALVAHGLVFSGCDELGDVRVAELPGHPFLLASLFQPELSSDENWAHPLIAAFAHAVRDRAASPAGPAPVGGALSR